MGKEIQCERLINRIFDVERQRKVILDELRLHPEYVELLMSRIESLNDSIEALMEQKRSLDRVLGWCYTAKRQRDTPLKEMTEDWEAFEKMKERTTSSFVPVDEGETE